MSLSHAILGLLTIAPMTGYVLKTQAFDAAIAHFWQADQTQIYRTLGEMAKAGWVEYTMEVQKDRPNRKVYRITDAGRAELLRWLRSPQPLPVYREPFLVQMFFGGLLEKSELLDHIQQQRAGHQARLTQYEQIPLPSITSGSLEPDRVYWRLTLEFGIALEKAYLQWLDQCAAIIRAQADE